MRCTRGFTLIELLVAIAIIMILAALTLPTIQGAHRAAWCANDASNLRQVQQAWAQYALNHETSTFRFVEGHHPKSWPMRLSPFFAEAWDVVLPFMGSDPLRVHDVPIEVVRKFISGVDDGECRDYMVPLFARCVFPAYGYNHQGWTPRYCPGRDGPLPSSERRGLSLTECHRPSRVIVFGTTVGMGLNKYEDYGWYRIEPYRQLTYPEPGAVLWRGSPPLVQNSFGGLSPQWGRRDRTNVSFADGHVETRNPAELTDVRLWDPQRR